MTDEEFLLYLANMGGELKIERGDLGHKAIAAPFSVDQIKRLVNEGKIRAAHVKVTPFHFSNKSGVQGFMTRKGFNSTSSTPEITYIHVTLLYHQPFMDVISMLNIHINKRNLLITAKSGKLEIVGHKNSMVKKRIGWIILTDAKKTKDYYYPNCFTLAFGR